MRSAMGSKDIYVRPYVISVDLAAGTVPLINHLAWCAARMR